MKKFLLGSAALITLGMASQASAADLGRPYTKAPPMMAAVYDWTGFYIGANGGYGTSRNCRDLVTIAPAIAVGGLSEGCHDADGGTAGGQIGYRWQTGGWVFGLEAQGNWADFKGSNVNTLGGTPFVAAGLVDETRIRAFGLFTGQVGYAWNNALLYVKGGAAMTDARYRTITAAGVVFDAASTTRWGGSAGVGLEYGFSPNWSVAVEYDHLFMDRFNLNSTLVTTGAFSATDRIRQDTDIVTARINYRWGGPVVAKY